jgi:hypothetical protein
VRFPAPEPKTLKREELLLHVREELEKRYPNYAAVMDLPGDPGWMLLQQAAWMAEVASEVVAEQPRQVIEYLLALLGRELRPATPALGVVALAGSDGVITRDGAEQPRIFAPTTSTRESIEFVLAEAEVPIADARFTGWYDAASGRVRGRQLTRADFPASHVAVADDGEDLRLDRERIVFGIDRAPDDDVLVSVLDDLVEATNGNGRSAIGWLELSWTPLEEGVELIAEVIVARPFGDDGAERRPRQWGRVGGWRPELDAVEGVKDLRIEVDSTGRPVLRGCPTARPTPELVWAREPAPSDFAQRLWDHFRASDPRFREQLPDSVPGRRETSGQAGVPVWLAELRFSRQWSQVRRRVGPMLSLRCRKPGGDRRVRVALLFDSSAPSFVPPPLEVLLERGATRRVHASWSALLPRPTGMGPGAVHAATYELGRKDLRRMGQATVQVVATGATRGAVLLGALLNPALVLNAPLEHDGREVVIDQGTGELDLLWPDLVDRRVLDRLCQGLPEATAGPMRTLLEELPVARLEVSQDQRRQAVLHDWSSMRLDPATGRAQWGVPGRTGRLTLKPGQTVRVETYRRTSGARGNLREDEISQVEQGEDADPRIDAVTNPLPTHLGEDAETASQAVYRMFGPERGALPVVPDDVERRAREALGPEEQHWTVRIWTHSERLLLETRLWGLDHGPEWVQKAGRAGLERLEELGPRGLLLVVGDPTAAVKVEDFHKVAARASRRIRAVGDRLPHFQDCVVLPFWPLTLHTEGDPPPAVLPSWRPGVLPDGALTGPSAKEPVVMERDFDLWLDAAVVSVNRVLRAARPKPPKDSAAAFSELGRNA